CARANGDRRQTQAAAVDEALACHVVNEKLAHRLLRAVGCLRRELRVVGYGVRERAAEDGERAREHEFWRPRKPAATLQKAAGRVEVDPHAGVELGFRLAA